jgi:hypothetical protein
MQFPSLVTFHRSGAEHSKAIVNIPETSQVIEMVPVAAIAIRCRTTGVRWKSATRMDNFTVNCVNRSRRSPQYRACLISKSASLRKKNEVLTFRAPSLSSELSLLGEFPMFCPGGLNIVDN